MANSFLTISMITREAIPLFLNTNAFLKSIDRQYDDEFGRAGEKIGNQLRIRLPNDFTVSHGPALSVQSTQEVQTTLVMAHQDHVDVSFSSADLLLDLDDFSERILLPMMNDLAADVASTIMSELADSGGICNVQGNFDNDNNLLTPNSGTFLGARARLNDNSTPMPGRKIVNDPWTESRVVQSLTGLLNPQPALSDQYYEGTMYRALGATWFMDQTVIKHTSGTATAATVSGADQTGTQVTISALSGTLVAGDFITIEDVEAVNRNTKDTTGMLRQFCLTSDAANGSVQLNIYPAITPPVAGEKVQYQTVTQSPDSGATITPVLNASTTYRRNFYYSPQFCTMATGDLPVPPDVKCSRHRYDSVSMRMVTQYIIGSDQAATRLDVLWGALSIRPEWSCCVPDIIGG